MHVLCRWTSMLALLCACMVIFGAVPLTAQTVDSGSDGSDGDLTLTAPGVHDFFDPTTFSRVLDPDADGIYHFRTITIAAGVTVNMTRTIRGPVVWLATGAVQIDGVIDLSGEDGHTIGAAFARPSLPGAGGYPGGSGARKPLMPPQAGSGPGGGVAGGLVIDPTGTFVLRLIQFGTGAGHAFQGVTLANVEHAGGIAYGNIFLLPLVGGSGGGGGGISGSLFPQFNNNDGGGGGAGGGAILIASAVSMTVNGTIQATGGAGVGVGPEESVGSGSEGGGGSGGSVRLIAPIISGTGIISALGGLVSVPNFPVPLVMMSGSPGRIRLEAFQHPFSGDVGPVVSFAPPGPIFLPANAPLIT